MTIIQATKAEISYIASICEDSAPMGRFNVSGVIRDRNGSGISMGIGDYILLTSNGDRDYHYTAQNVRGGVVDLLVSDMNAERWEINQFGIKREITLDRNMSGLDLNLSEEGIGSLVHKFDVTGGYGVALLFSKNGSAVHIGRNSSELNSWSALKSGTIKGDLYAFECWNGEGIMVFDIKSALNDPGDVEYDLTNVAPFSMNVAWGNDIVLENLDYTPTTSSPQMRLYTISLKQGKSDEDEKEIWLSKGWLGNQTNYTVPDLSKISGWDGGWFSLTEPIKWNGIAIMSNKGIEEISTNIEEREEFYYIGVEDLQMHWAMDMDSAYPPSE